MPQIDYQLTDELVCPTCDRCDATMRLFGIESHPTARRADLHTYVCEQCEALHTETVPLRPLLLLREGKPIMPKPQLANAAFGPETTCFLASAFEDAWKRLSASDSSLTDASDAASARERLAKYVIEMGRLDVRNRERFIENAMARFREMAACVSPDTAIPRTNQFLATLPLRDYLLLAPHLRIVKLEQGAVLHDADEPIEHIYFPYSGMVSVLTMMRSGDTVEAASLGQGGVIGAIAALGAGRTVGRATVRLAGAASRISSSQFRAAAQESEAISELAIRYNDLLVAQIHQSVACIALHTVEARLCRCLLQTHDCVDGNDIPLTQELLAQMLGVRRTSVTLAAGLLQSTGIIRYHRGHIQVLDRARLEDAACECYAMLKERADNIFAERSAAVG
jgi:CRP-like cAMP-binding protein